MCDGNNLDYLQKGTNKAKLKQLAKNILMVVDDVKGMKEMERFLQQMHKAVTQENIATSTIK